ncbi:MAG: GNAT family N-acetyltransferase [Novosphingobium aromaticivorans]|nr:GNAT family N-acetyltransferase [Novosphingobium aromaticivorans]
MTLRVYHAEPEEAQAHPRLGALMRRGQAAGPFDRLDWLTLLARECLSPARPFLAVAEEDGAILALPLLQGPHGLSACANWYSFWARPLTNAPDRAPALIAALARTLDAPLDFAPLPTREAGWMAQGLRAAGWLAMVEPAHMNRHLALEGRDFATWWATRPGALRATVRRKSRQGRVACRIATTFDEADWAAFEAIYAASWKPQEASPAFLRAFAQGESAAGALRLGLATIEGEPVAAQVWSVEAQTAFIHKLAHRPQASRASPGTLLTAALMRHVIDNDRVAHVDFGTGDDPYKADWMDDVRPRWRLRAHNPRALIRAPLRHWRDWPDLARGLARLATGRTRLAPPPGDD